MDPRHPPDFQEVVEEEEVEVPGDMDIAYQRDRNTRQRLKMPLAFRSAVLYAMDI